jgi:acetamidase/formamidase
MVETVSEIMTVGHGKTVEDAYTIALDNMATLITKKLELDFIDAIMLISIAADVRINQIVNTVAVGARVALPLSVL